MLIDEIRCFGRALAASPERFVGFFSGIASVLESPKITQAFTAALGPAPAEERALQAATALVAEGRLSPNYKLSAASLLFEALERGEQPFQDLLASLASTQPDAAG